MDIGERLYVTSREKWREWLEEHHQDTKEIWLILFKKASGRQSLPLGEAVEEALCFGWIDSQLKPLDEASYALRFSPRRQKSIWAESNKARIRKLIQEGKMTPAGLAVIPPDILDAE